MQPMTTYTRGDLMISSPNESLVLELATLSIGGKPAAITAAASDVPAIGARWFRQGGVNGGLFPGGDRPYYLIVPTGADAEGSLEWGAYGDQVNGADSAWDGQANTADLMGADSTHPAANFCAEFERDGHNDFYLMSRREASFLEITLADVFSKNWHWTSSQRSAHSAFYMTFDDGTQDDFAKNLELRVRPVRRLFI